MKYIILISALIITSSLKAQKRKYRAYETCSVILNDENSKCNFEKSNTLILVYEYKMIVYTKEIIQLMLISDATVTNDETGRKIVSWTAEDQNKNHLQLKFITYTNSDGTNSSNMVLSYINKKLHSNWGRQMKMIKKIIFKGETGHIPCK